RLNETSDVNAIMDFKSPSKAMPSVRSSVGERRERTNSVGNAKSEAKSVIRAFGRSRELRKSSLKPAKSGSDKAKIAWTGRSVVSSGLGSYPSGITKAAAA